LAVLILIFVVITLFIIFFYRGPNKGEKQTGNWLQFFTRGKEAGFSIRELEQLRRLVVNCNIDDPASIFASQKQLETCIRSVVNAVRMSGESEDPAIQDFLSRLFDYCKDVGLKNAEKKATITSSRQISEGQALKVLLPGTGTFKSEIVKNMANSLTITRPTNTKITNTPRWQGMNVSVYFWREDDAGYVFDSEVIDEVFSKGISSLKIEHNDSLFRTQKRKSLRVKIHKDAFVYLVNDLDPHKLEKSPGLRCRMEDISDTGCAFNVKGMAPIGQRLKVQFSLDRIPVCMPGTVRSVDYKQESNTSLIHMESDPLPIGVRNHILCEVFDLLPDDDEDELPFRVVENEANNPSPPPPNTNNEVVNV
jgi:c-di-GMP-binding flagellar brake protein YcgR